MEHARHWTEDSVAGFLYKIAADFVTQLEEKMDSLPLSQSEVAERLGVSEGRVSQILNNPGNLTLKMIIKCARSLGLKVALVAYDDKDPANERGPINSDIFRICWENQGRPRTFRYLQSQAPQTDALTSEARLVPAGPRGHFIIDRSAYANRAHGSSPYAQVNVSVSNDQPTVGSLIVADDANVIVYDLKQGA